MRLTERRVKHTHLLITDIDDNTVTYSCPFHNKPEEQLTELISTVNKRKYGCHHCAVKFRKRYDFVSRKIPNDARSNVLIDEVSRHFDHKFNYDNFKPEHYQEASFITCPKHGELHISAIEHMVLHGQYGCPMCREEARSEEARSEEADSVLGIDEELEAPAEAMIHAQDETQSHDSTDNDATETLAECRVTDEAEDHNLSVPSSSEPKNQEGFTVSQDWLLEAKQLFNRNIM